jgi:hypothetical protein
MNRSHTSFHLAIGLILAMNNPTQVVESLPDLCIPKPLRKTVLIISTSESERLRAYPRPGLIASKILYASQAILIRAFKQAETRWRAIVIPRVTAKPISTNVRIMQMLLMAMIRPNTA